jgi:hypothetical protein
VTTLRILPGNQLNGSAVDLPKTMVDLPPPRFFGVLVNFRIGLSGKSRSSGANFGGESASFSTSAKSLG